MIIRIIINISMGMINQTSTPEFYDTVVRSNALVACNASKIRE